MGVPAAAAGCLLPTTNHQNQILTAKRNIDICAAFIKHTPVQTQSASGVSF
jgi:hypothetical protein